MTNANEPANPIIEQRYTDKVVSVCTGLTKREYFAALAMQGLLANPNVQKELCYSTMAIKLADELIDELNKPQ